jgi:serine/threonine protein kinase
LRKEAANLMSLKHRNVVELFGVCFRPPALVTEFMGCGSLFDYLQNESVTDIPWNIRLRFASDIARGMSFLHGTTPPVLHRDLKSANVLLSESLTAKISDFGTVVMFAPFTTGRTVANPRWLAPEVLKSEPYGTAADVYSFGMLLWEISTREIPFMDKPSYQWCHNVEDDVIKGVRPTIPANVPVAFRELMGHCWSQQPEERPTFEQILRRIPSEITADDTIALREAKKK